MVSTRLVFFACFLINSLAADYVINNKRFPSDFMFGVATSAYQIEGGWNEDGRTPSNWDHMTHTRPEFVKDRSNGDIACDSYHKFKEDVAIMKKMGVKHYRFSLSWNRILPTGFPDKINEPGIAYYKNLIKELKTNNIVPLVTIHHWDLPQSLQNLGGFLNASIVDWVADYARVCYKAFGDDVKYWLTFNEAKQICMGGFGFGYYPPAIHSEGILEYVCAHNLLKAHAKAWHIYDKEFRAKQNGKVSVVLDSSAYIPASNKPEDKVATDTVLHFELGWFANPIYNGDYPEIMKTRVAERSKREGRPKSRLPEFTEEEKAFIKGTHDYFAMNTYTSYLVESIPDPGIQDPPTRWSDIGVNNFQPDTWENTTMEQDWFKIAPWGMRTLLKWIKYHYSNPEIIVTENGVCDYGDMEDDKRISYIRDNLSYLRDAMIEDGVRVFGYTVWSIIDNFEWQHGYTQKYGLYQVDFDDPKRTRKPKKSADFYKKVCTTRCITDKCVD
nr:myrosinase 1-like isoform X1 [Leptinotarsa decemlineata]XP_023020549.1 myrosinase 1-like isoform X2 [Leptinotarsa decemlineata]